MGNLPGSYVGHQCRGWPIARRHLSFELIHGSLIDGAVGVDHLLKQAPADCPVWRGHALSA